MAPPRLVLITPRYWPHAGDLEMTAARLAQGLQAQGVRVTILTGSWDAEWPRQFEMHGSRVERVAYAPRGGWSTFRYVTALRQWLNERRQEIDIVYSMTLSHEASAAVGAFRGTKTPIVLCAQDWPAGSTNLRRIADRGGPRIKRVCAQTSAIVAPHEAIAEELIHEGCEASRLHVIRQGVARYEPRSADRRYRARVSLAEANHDLAAAEYAPVALSIVRLSDFATLSQLISAWQRIAASWPSARLWLIGDGPERASLRALVGDTDLRYQVFLPGSFEEWTDLFAAADVYLAPGSHRRTQIVLEAMAAGLPVIAAESIDLRGMIEHNVNGWMVANGSAHGWSQALAHMFENAELMSAAGRASRETAERRFSLDEMAQAHLSLFSSLIDKNRS